jgi:hypothetical protein
MKKSLMHICDLCQKNRDDVPKIYVSLHKQIEHFTSFNLVPGSSILDNYFSTISTISTIFLIFIFLKSKTMLPTSSRFYWHRSHFLSGISLAN